MGGLIEHYSAGDAAVLSIEAGSDLILKSADTDAAIAAVKDAIRSGRISESRIDQSVQRILDAKRRVVHPAATQDEIFRVVDSAEHKRVAADIATRAITLVRAEPTALPLRRDARIVVVAINDAGESKSFPSVTLDEITKRAASPPLTFTIDGRSRVEENESILAAANNSDVVLLALAVRAISGLGHLRLPDAARDLVQRLPPEKTIAISFGSPYVLRDLPSSMPTYLCAYGIQSVMQTAAVRALYGETPITGRLPVTVGTPRPR
jgi:beta-N-acetylhexosaminidase